MHLPRRMQELRLKQNEMNEPIRQVSYPQLHESVYSFIHLQPNPHTAIATQIIHDSIVHKRLGLTLT